MITLRACPSGLTVVPLPRRPRPGSPSSLRVVTPSGSKSLLSLKTTSSAGWTTAARISGRSATRAQNGAFSDLIPDDDKPVTEEQVNKFRAALKNYCKLPKDMPFREEIETIDDYSAKMTSWKTSIFHIRATTLSLTLCESVRKGVVLASAVMDSVVLKFDEHSEISLHTTKQILAMYVSIFVNLAEETYHQRFNVESVYSFLGAFGGLAAVSHILVQDALASPNYHKDNSFISEIDVARSVFQQEMNTLEDKFKAVTNSTNFCEVSEVLWHTMANTMILSMFFVFKMVARRDTVLGIDSGAKRRRSFVSARQSDDGEPDAAEATSSK